MSSAAVGMRCPDCRGQSKVRDLRQVVARGGTHTAIATTVLIGLNVAAFLVQLVQGSPINSGVAGRLAQDGALFGPLVGDGEWWRLVTGGFLHAGIIHLAFNMYMLYILGTALERYAGSFRMIAIYLASVLGGSAGALVVDQITGRNSFTVGASGGVFGLMAALLVLERSKGVSLLGGGIGGVLAINLVFTFVFPGISIGGHLGGIVAGALTAFVLSGYGRGHLAYGKLTPPVIIGLVGVFGGSIGLALAMTAA